MIIRLSGLQEASRRIEVAVTGLIDRAKKVIQQEVEELEIQINAQLESDLKGLLKIEVSGDSIILRLPFEGRTGKTARWQHNPKFWSKYGKAKGISLHQPFQDVLTRRGYTNISPGRGDPIESSSGSAPNVRITAKLPDSIIQEIVRS
jgi:hypothetical protein